MPAEHSETPARRGLRELASAALNDSNDCMAQLVVRDLELNVVQRLKKRAVEHGVSAEEEHRRILRQALSESEDEFPDLKALLLAMPDAGEDKDFERIREFPREVESS